MLKKLHTGMIADGKERSSLKLMMANDLMLLNLK